MGRRFCTAVGLLLCLQWLALAPAAHAATSSGPPDVRSFSSTGSAQYYTVPAGIHAVEVDAYGAAGGDGGRASGGLGARAHASWVVVSPGEVLQVRAGGAGTSATDSGGGAPGYNGAGAGGAGANGIGGGGGGGASDVRRSPFGEADRLVVAGGGGGGGGEGGEGGAGGETGADGTSGEAAAGQSGGNGGFGGRGDGLEAGADATGALGGQGGTGDQNGGGGGGGGYVGGGGGAGSAAGGGGGGGGGSSFGPSGSVFTDAARSGNGAVTITADAVLQTFSYSGGSETFNVPDGLDHISVDAFGAQGATLANSAPGKGGAVHGYLAASGQLSVAVGGAASGATRGYPCGGAGGSGSSHAGGGGGGASYVGSMIAGGGGGAGGTSSGVGAFGGGGGESGQNGGTTIFAGGSAGGNGGAGGPGASDGTFDCGGDGAPGQTNGGGGGGDGAFGGGGGGAVSFTSADGSGGGGGSSTGPSGAVYETGTRSGNGLVLISYTTDTTAPGVSVNGIGPFGVATNDTTPAIGGTAGHASGDDPTKVTLELYSGTTATGSPIATFTADPNDGNGVYAASPSTALSDGEYTVKVSQTDAAGNVGSATRTFTIDTDPPHLDLSNTLSSSRTGFIGGHQGTAPGDGYTIAKVYDGYDTSGALRYTYNVAWGGGSSFGTDLVLEDGYYTVQATQSDWVGNTTTVSRTFRVDTQAPVVTLTQPDAPTNDPTPDLSGTAEFGPEVYLTVDVSISSEDDPPTTEAQDIIVNLGDSSFVATPSVLPDGHYVATATQRDTAGNIGTSAPFHFTVDTSGPVVTFDQTPKLKTRSRKATFGFHSSEDPSTFTCQLDSKQATSCTSPITLSHLRVGRHAFTVIATDQAGNAGEPQVYRWKVRS